MYVIKIASGTNRQEFLLEKLYGDDQLVDDMKVTLIYHRNWLVIQMRFILLRLILCIPKFPFHHSPMGDYIPWIPLHYPLL